MLRRQGVRFIASTIRQRGDPALERVCPPLSTEILRHPMEPCITKFPLVCPAAESTPAFGRNKYVRTAPSLVSLDAMVADLHEALEEFRKTSGYGRGIAGPQLGYFARVIALNLNGEKHTLINPEWVCKSKETFTMWDDCFSHPDELVRVRRHVGGDIRFTTTRGDFLEWMNLDQGTCELLQHEMDHLDGLLSFRRAEPVKVPSTSRLASEFRSSLAFDASGRLSVVPRRVWEAAKADCMKLVSPQHQDTE